MNPALVIVLWAVGSTWAAKFRSKDQPSPTPKLSYNGSALDIVANFAGGRRVEAGTSGCATGNPKFFWECRWNSHRDMKYSKGKPDLSLEETRQEIHSLMLRLSADSAQRGVKPIIIAGCLIGSYFGGEPLPWDDDCDLAFLEDDFRKLRMYSDDNFEFRINPYWAFRGADNAHTDDDYNRVDARLISKSTGYFLDILSLTADKNVRGLVFAKGPDNPELSLSWLLPLKKTTFNRISGLYVPNDVRPVLNARYGPGVLHPRYKDWVFDEKTKKWSREHK